MADDFQRADVDAEATAVAVVGNGPDGMAMPRNLTEHRAELVTKYHKGAPNLLMRLKREGRTSLEDVIPALVEEIILEGDALLGNGLVATEEGLIRDSTIISAKRAEVMSLAIKAVQTKLAFERETGLDLNSPSMLIVLKYFMAKVKGVMAKMNAGDEFNDTFFRMLGEDLDGWKKELQEELDELGHLGARSAERGRG